MGSENPVSEEWAHCVNPAQSVYQALCAMEEVNPDASIVSVWMGDNWPDPRPHLGVRCLAHGVEVFSYRLNPDADTFIEFSDGHFIAARTDEQARINAPLRFGIARKETGRATSKSARKAKGKR